MNNIRLPKDLQDEVRHFMMLTQNNLNTQNELNDFLSMISPSIRNKVTKHIFLDAISSNPIFSSSEELTNFLVSDVKIYLFMPEDYIITQGQKGENLFMLAKGNCTVWVRDYNKRNILVNNLSQGEYFGEISLLTDQCRTASVKSQNYCTLACINKETFSEVCKNFPEIMWKMKKKCNNYQDPWKKMKEKML
jgi:CRP-like cAMP-binding protein